MNKLYFSLFLFLFTISSSVAAIDEVADKLPKDVITILPYSDYNFESTIKLPINLKVLERIKSEKDLYEGQIVKFKVAKDVVYKDKVIIERGLTVPAKVSIIIAHGMNGIPASVIFNDFIIENIDSTKISENYEISGQDRSLMVFPLKWALTVLPPTGSLTNFIMGGHAKLKTNEIITIYYYPEWK